MPRFARKEPLPEGVETPKPDHRTILETYLDVGSYNGAAKRLGLHDETVRRLIRSPAGGFALEQLQRERNRQRAIHLGAVVDKLLHKLEKTIDRGNEHQLMARRADEPYTIFLQPHLAEIAKAISTATAHLQTLQDSLSTVDLTDHDISHESRAQNLETLKALVAAEERRMLQTPVQLEHLQASSTLETSPAGDPEHLEAMLSDRSGDRLVLGLTTQNQARPCGGGEASTARIDAPLEASTPGFARVAALSGAETVDTLEENPESFRGVAPGVAQPPTPPRPRVGYQNEKAPPSADETPGEVSEEDLK